MTPSRPTALIAEDEPLLRDALETLLRETWPDLEVVARPRNGREAVAEFEAERPQICFLDVKMPGMSGIEVARRIGRRAHVVFVTAFDEHAVRAFEEGAVDYLVKPVDRSRLARTVDRLKQLLERRSSARDLERILEKLVDSPQSRAFAPALQWIRASVGSSVRVIPIAAVDFFRSDEKYTVVGWRGDGGVPREAVIRASLKELVPQLDPAVFVQVHRSVVVNLRSVELVHREANETASIELRGRKDVLPVSRSYLHLFRQM